MTLVKYNLVRKETMMMKKILPAGMVLSLLICCSSVRGDRAASPLPPFYPESKPAAVYDPNRFVSKKNAAIDLPSGPVSESNFNTSISLNGAWKFSGLERASSPFSNDADLSRGHAASDFDDSRWDSIPVPLNFYLKYKYEPKNPYVKGWYRKTVMVPADAGNKRVVLHFGVVGYEALLFVNGKPAGAHHGDFTPWDVDISALVEPGKPAVIALRVFSDLGPNKSCNASSIIKTSRHPYGSQYAPDNIKGGIWRSVEMRITPAVCIDSVLVNPELENSSILISCKIVNPGMAARTVELYGKVIDAAAKAPVASPASTTKLSSVTLMPGENKVELRIALKNPKLWSPDAPNLYNLVLALVDNGTPCAVKGERFGFRSFKAEGDHFLLNGRRIYLFGESIEVASSFENGKPELDQPDANPQALKAAAQVLLGFKSRGSNTLRLSEQPVAEVFLDLADEVGMMIYDMWAWSYNNNLDPSFEKNDFEELSEWMRRDYNHPSVVMWLGGNEVKCNASLVEIFDRQTKLIRSIDRSGRPVSVFSGIDYAGKFKLDTDMLDLHSYTGLYDQWVLWEQNFNHHYAQALTSYSKNGKILDKPYVVWELVGFSWGQRSSDYQPGDVDTFLKWAKGPTSWGAPNGIGWSGSIGLAAALDPKRGGRWGMENIGRKIMEYVRQDTRICGFAPWFCKNSITLPATSLWTQPVYCGIRGENGIPLRNVFGGNEYPQDLFVVNSSNVSYDGAVMRFSLAEADGSETPLTEYKPGMLPPWQKITAGVKLSIPTSKESRWAQIRLQVMGKDGKEISRNFYDIFVQNREKVMAPLMTEASVGILSCNSTGTATLKQILNVLQIKTTDISDPKDLDKCTVLIIPPSKKELNGLGAESSLMLAVLNWVRKGGTLLVLEQQWSGDFSLLSRRLRPVQTLLADLVVPAHPAFHGLSQANFEFWNNPTRGQTAGYVYNHLSRDVIAARGPMLGSSETFSVLCDGTLGKGRILASQFDACALWDVDSAAGTYLRNLLGAALSAAPGSIKPWEMRSNNLVLNNAAGVIPLNLKDKVNMGFKDDVAGDHKGGWTDQGENDFRMMPLGRQVFRGVPFEIINPVSNGGKSCLVVKGKAEGDFVVSVKGIKLGQRFLRLFFLHCDAFSSSGNGLKYVIHYRDGKTLEVQTIQDVSIGDWWNCGDLPNAKLAFSQTNLKAREVGLFIMEWDNPRPDVPVESLDIIAADDRNTVSMVVAISGETANAETLALGDGKWNCRADAGPGNVLKDGVFVPALEKVPVEGHDVIKVKMPKHKEGEPRPVIFTRFTVPDNVKKMKEPFRYLSFELNAESSGEIEIFIPDQNFKTMLRKTLPLGKNTLFYHVRIPLDYNLFKPEDLRGEIYIFSSSDKTKELPAFAFKIRNIRLE